MHFARGKCWNPLRKVSLNELATFSLGPVGPTFTGSLHYRQRYIYAFLWVRNANATCTYHEILQQQHNLLNPPSKVNSNLRCLETIYKLPVSKTSDHNQYRVSCYHCLPAQHSTRLQVPIHAHSFNQPMLEWEKESRAFLPSPRLLSLLPQSQLKASLGDLVFNSVENFSAQQSTAP